MRLINLKFMHGAKLICKVQKCANFCTMKKFANCKILHLFCIASFLHCIILHFAQFCTLRNSAHCILCTLYNLHFAIFLHVAQFYIPVSWRTDEHEKWLFLKFQWVSHCQSVTMISGRDGSASENPKLPTLHWPSWPSPFHDSDHDQVAQFLTHLEYPLVQLGRIDPMKY